MKLKVKKKKPRVIKQPKMKRKFACKNEKIQKLRSWIPFRAGDKIPPRMTVTGRFIRHI